MRENTEKRSGWRWWYLLFLVQFVAVLWPPFFNKADPALAGIPFFYWYQLLWVIIGAVLTAIVYFAVKDRTDPTDVASTPRSREVGR